MRMTLVLFVASITIIGCVDEGARPEDALTIAVSVRRDSLVEPDGFNQKGDHLREPNRWREDPVLQDGRGHG